MFNLGMVGIVNSLIFGAFTDATNFLVPFKSSPDLALDWLKLISLGVLGFWGQQMKALAMQLETAGVATALRKAFDTFFSFLFQIWFFSVSFSKTSN